MRSNGAALPWVFLVVSLITAPAVSQTFAPGDVVVSVQAPGPTPTQSSDKVLWFDANGTFKGVLYNQNPITRLIETGFGPGGALYIGLEGYLRRLAPDGTVSGSSPFIEPHRFTFAADGRIYTSFQTGGEIINEVDSSLQLTDTFNRAPERIEGVDLAADQCTLFYATYSPAATIGRFNVCSGTPLPAFVTETGIFYGAIRLLSGGGMLHSRGFDIVRRDNIGTVVQTYPNYRLIALDPDRRSFWTTRGLSLYKIDIATGAVVLGPIAVGNDTVNIWSITVFGEPRAALDSHTADVPSLTGWSLLMLVSLIGVAAVLRMR